MSELSSLKIFSLHLLRVFSFCDSLFLSEVEFSKGQIQRSSTFFHATASNYFLLKEKGFFMFFFQLRLYTNAIHIIRQIFKVCNVNLFVSKFYSRLKIADSRFLLYFFCLLPLLPISFRLRHKNRRREEFYKWWRSVLGNSREINRILALVVCRFFLHSSPLLSWSWYKKEAFAFAVFLDWLYSADSVCYV